MSIRIGICAGACAAIASAATAGISGIQWTPIQINALNLAPDNAWTYGDDYLFAEYHVDMFEDWVGGYGTDVTFDISLELDDITPRVPVTGLTFDKSVTNNTDFFWSAFQIVLTPGMNSTLSNVFANPNDEFEDVSVMAGGNGSFIILWEQGMNGTGVNPGDTTTFNFGFMVDGNLGFMMKQTPIPAPGGVAALGVAALLGVRRRRAA